MGFVSVSELRCLRVRMDWLRLLVPNASQTQVCSP